MIQLILLLVVLGVILYLIENYVPISPPFIVVIRIIIVIFSILLLLRAFGVVDVPVPTIK